MSSSQLTNDMVLIEPDIERSRSVISWYRSIKIENPEGSEKIDIVWHVDYPKHYAMSRKYFILLSDPLPIDVLGVIKYFLSQGYMYIITNPSEKN